jgi:hypothetical protein
MIRKIKAFWALFQAGKRVGNPATWKTRQIGVDAVHGMLWAAVTVWSLHTGQEVPVTGEALDGISLAVVTAVPAIVELYNIVSTIITTNKIGLQSKSDAVGGGEA